MGTGQELIDFLRSTVLSVATADRKYTATLRTMILDIPLGLHSIEDAQDTGALDKMTRSSKRRKKTNKSGLQPGEEEYVMRWWLGHAHDGSDDHAPDTYEQKVARCLAHQRLRETQLQVIGILEILTWERMMDPYMTDGHQVDNASQSKDHKANDKAARNLHATKSTKRHDLETLLNVLIDRLCIWQSMENEKRGSQGTEKFDLDFSMSCTNDEQLRSFCTEVILPFYAGRLPQLYQSMCKKLGVYSAISPARTKVSDLPSVRSGQVTTGDAKRSMVRSTERTLTEGKVASHKGRGKLTRAATDSALPMLARDLNVATPAVMARIHGRLQDSKRYAQREVDLTAMSQARQTKVQRRAAIAHELRGAIDAVKKPNARAAVRELVESADRRAVGRARGTRRTLAFPFSCSWTTDVSDRRGCRSSHRASQCSDFGHASEPETS